MKISARTKEVLRWVIAIVIVVLLLPVYAEAKKTNPKLISSESVEFSESSDEIFQVTIPYIHLAPMHQEIVKQYKDFVVATLAKESHTDIKDYHVKRASMSDEAPKGYYLIYYETIYNKQICEVSAVSVDDRGNYSIKTSHC